MMLKKEVFKTSVGSYTTWTREKDGLPKWCLVLSRIFRSKEYWIAVITYKRLWGGAFWRKVRVLGINDWVPKWYSYATLHEEGGRTRLEEG